MNKPARENKIVFTDVCIQEEIRLNNKKEN